MAVLKLFPQLFIMGFPNKIVLSLYDDLPTNSITQIFKNASFFDSIYPNFNFLYIGKNAIIKNINNGIPVLILTKNG